MEWATTLTLDDLSTDSIDENLIQTFSFLHRMDQIRESSSNLEGHEEIHTSNLMPNKRYLLEDKVLDESNVSLLQGIGAIIVVFQTILLIATYFFRKSHRQRIQAQQRHREQAFHHQEGVPIASQRRRGKRSTGKEIFLHPSVIPEEQEEGSGVMVGDTTNDDTCSILSIQSHPSIPILPHTKLEDDVDERNEVSGVTTSIIARGTQLFIDLNQLFYSREPDDENCQDANIYEA